MSRKVHFSQRARDDVERAYLYIRQDSPERASNWRKRLLLAIRSLKVFPERHAVVFDAAAAGRNVRQMTFGVYAVLYSIDDDRVNVLTFGMPHGGPSSPARYWKANSYRFSRCQRRESGYHGVGRKN